MADTILTEAIHTVLAQTTVILAREALGAAATSHAHAIADTTGLQAALDAKAAASHNHAGHALTPQSVASAGAISGTTGTFNGLLSAISGISLTDAARIDNSFRVSGDALDEKQWDMNSSALGAGQFGIITRTDAGALGEIGLEMRRTGAAITSVRLLQDNLIVEPGKITIPTGNVGIGTATPGEKVEVAGNIKASGFIRSGAYTVAEANALTAAAAGAGAQIYVTNETGGAVPAFSDGTDWRRVTDRAVIA